MPNGFSTGIHYDQIFVRICKLRHAVIRCANVEPACLKLRAGESEFLTAWVPIGDCTASGGGLMYLEHSDDIGKDMEDDFTERASTFTPEERINGFNQNMARDGQLSHDVIEFDEQLRQGAFGDRNRKRRWLAGNYEAGDVVFHNPYLIHGAVKNQDPMGRVRLSTDLRFYEEGKSLDQRWMQLWKRDDGL